MRLAVKRILEGEVDHLTKPEWKPKFPLQTRAMSYLVRSYTAEGHRTAAAWPREAKRRPARSKILPHRRFRSLRRRRRRSRLSAQPKATGRSRATRCSCPSPPTAHRERLVGGNLFLSRERVCVREREAVACKQASKGRRRSTRVVQPRRPKKEGSF